MSSGNDPITWRTDQERRERIESFKDARGFKNRSKALDCVVDVGLREQQNPIVWRFKDRVIEWINLLTISAVIVFVLGAATEVLAIGQAVAASVAMLILATMFMAAFELTRTTLGMNELGAKVRDVLGRDRV